MCPFDRPRSSVAVASAAGIAVLLAGCGAERAAPTPDFVSPEVCLALGHASATAYAAQHHPVIQRPHTLPSGEVLMRQLSVIDALADERAAIVRLAVGYQSGGASRTSHGSGVLVASGRFVLTAGHALVEVPDLQAADIRFYLPREARDPSARDREFTARVVAWRYGDDDQGSMQDWALLEVDSPADHMPFARTAAAASSVMQFCYGFPVQLGVDARGAVVPWQV